MSSVLILGDVHLGKSQSLGKNIIGSNVNSRVIDQVNLLDWTLDKAIDHNITDIVLTGDVFEDPKPQTTLIGMFISWLKRCEVNSINVHIIIGNHDVLRTGVVYTSALDIIEESGLENVNVYRNMNTVILDGFGITFMPFRDRKSLLLSSNSEAIDFLREQLIYESSIIPSSYKKIVIGHLSIEGSIYVGDEIDDISNELMCPLSMFQDYDYVWMGHVHKPQIFNEQPHIAHIGSMDISDFGEVDHEKKIVIFDPCLPNFYEYYKIPTRNLNKINICIPEDTEDVNNYLLEEIKNKNLTNSIVKLEIDVSQYGKSINKSQIEKSLISLGAFNVTSILETKKQNSLKKESNKITSKMDVTSAIKQYAESYISESEMSDFIETSMEIYKEFQEQL